jgi:cell division septal protein FtsQ
MERLPLLGIAILVFVVVISQLVLTTHPKLIILSSSSNSDLFLQSTAVYQSAADKLFSQSLGNQNKLTVDAGGISNKLKAMFPELSDVSVALPVVGNQPIVYLQPSEPTFILSANNNSYVIDNTGRALAFAQAMPAQNRASLPQIVDQSGLLPQVGNQVLPSTSVTFMQTVLAQLKAQHIAVSKIVLPSASFEVDMYISGKPYFVKFNMQDASGVLQQVGSYVTVAQNLSGKNITPSQYIDVRIDGRAYYK